MFKLLEKMPLIPRYISITDVEAMWNSDYIGVGGFGYVFGGVYKGKQVALKLLHKIRREVSVSSDSLFSPVDYLLFVHKRGLQRGVNMAIALA